MQLPLCCPSGAGIHAYGDQHRQILGHGSSTSRQMPQLKYDTGSTMSGCQSKDGRWVCGYPKGRDPERPRTTVKYFGRGPEAKREAEKFLSLGKNSPARQPPLHRVDEFLSDGQGNIMAKSSYENLCIKLEGVILPELGQEMAHRLTPDRLDQYVSTRARMVKRTTVHQELTYIRAVLRWAVSRRLLFSNPMDGFELPKRDDARIQPPTKAEFEAILAKAVPHMKRAMLIAYHTGLRPGREELLRLTWNDVDLIGKTLMVTSADKGGLPVRMVPLNKVIMEHLNQWFDEDLKTGMRHLIHYHGGPVESLKTAWKAAKKRARVTRRLRMYDIRHAFITTLLEKGADLKSVSEIAGHSSPDMTMKVYQHVSNDLKRQAVDLLG